MPFRGLNMGVEDVFLQEVNSYIQMTVNTHKDTAFQYYNSGGGLHT